MQTKWFDEELNLEFNRNVQARLPRKTAWPTEVWRDNLPRCSLSSADPEPWFLLYSVSILSRFWTSTTAPAVYRLILPSRLQTNTELRR